MKRSVPAISSIICLFALLCTTTARADVKLPKALGDHMVLQQKSPVTIWGWADPGEKIAVLFAGAKATAVAGKDGAWETQVQPPAAGGPYNLVIEGKNRIELKDVLVGEVWICSGQSNMAWTVSRALNPEQEIAAAKFPKIRLLTVERRTARTPQADLIAASGWRPCTPETVKDFSAAGYFFGRKLHQELNVPIGLVNTSWGGTRAEAWTSMEMLEKKPSLKPILSTWEQRSKEYDPATAKKRYQAALMRWQAAAEKAKAAGRRPPRRPALQGPPADDRHHPANLYNAMIHPFTPMRIRGAIWYQGEANTGRADQYRTLFPAMITDWRAKWQQGDFPFLFAQLAPFRYGNRHPESEAELWDSQFKTLSLPNTGMAVLTDIGNTQNIHPANKQEVGRRLALWALANTYDQELVYSGPLYKSMKVEGDKIRLMFNHTGGGLMAKDGDLTYFTIAGKDQKFVPAKAVIDGDTVVVSSDEVKQPVAVRFGWTDTAEPNFFNKSGLPASPFRTDDFKLRTAGSTTP